jgi:hypothetical protein
MFRRNLLQRFMTFFRRGYSRAPCTASLTVFLCGSPSHTSDTYGSGFHPWWRMMSIREPCAFL